MKTKKLLQLIKDNAREQRTAIRAEAGADGTHVYIYDVIDSYWGASAADLIKQLASAAGKDVHMHYNSPGGDVFEGRAMAAALASYGGKVITHIDGLCASAATYPALAGSDVRMSDGSLFMIHNSWTMAMGDCTELRQTADLLQKIDGTINADYAKRTGATAEQVTTWMDAETWFTAQEALDAGFIDAIEANTKTSGTQDHWNLSAYANAPAPIAPTDATKSAPPEPDLTAQAAALQQRNHNRLRLLEQTPI